MRGNSFALLEKDWPLMDASQWNEFLRTAGEMSQKQRRKLVGEFEEHNAGMDRPTRRGWLTRFMGSFKPLSVDEKKAWWKVLDKTCLPAIVAVDLGLDFQGQEEIFVRQTMRTLARSFPESSFRAWDLLNEKERLGAFDLVLGGLLHCAHDFMNNDWWNEFERRSKDMPNNQRRQVALVLFEYSRKAHGDGHHEERELVEDLLDMFVPPPAQILTLIAPHTEDPWGMLPCRLANEEQYRLEQATETAPSQSRALRF